MGSEFEQRLAKVRHRFAGSLTGKINDSVAALPQLSADASDARAEVDTVYRRIHGICGVAPTVGFIATGKAAREAEVALIGPMRARRGLSATESAVLERALDALAKAAELELEMMHARGG